MVETSIENVKSIFRTFAKFNKKQTECLILEIVGEDMDALFEIREMISHIQQEYRIH